MPAGMIDGRRLKRAWDQSELGELILGQPPYDYAPGEETDSARFTRLHQLVDFLRCRTATERASRLPTGVRVLEQSELGFAQAAAIWLRQIFPEGGG
ncbi:MAG: hypothetical protein M5U01_04930 [Ardenticatenaceae bacterium]|nr:hypothetical protein [Ardenticatenaceae bacterium]HBY96702.1 hypothetical protein [Chloroflexota bacterium]